MTKYPGDAVSEAAPEFSQAAADYAAAQRLERAREIAARPSYRFKFAIVDETSGEVLYNDFCLITDIDQFGACESVDMHVAAMLRGWRRKVRAEYEAKEYPAEVA